MDTQLFGVPLYITLAIVMGIAQIALDIYQINAWGVGTVRDTPWLRRSSLMPLSYVRSWFRRLRQLATSEIGEVSVDLLTAGTASKRRRQDPPEIVHEGTVIKLPADPKMTLRQAVQWLTKIEQAEEQTIAVSETIDAYPWDGARALGMAIRRRFGFAETQTVRSFFGSNPPQSISVTVDVGKTEPIIWGRMILPGIDGYVNCGSTNNDAGQLVFQLYAEVKRKDAPIVSELAQLTREILKTESIYRGKAVRFSVDSDGDVQVPQFTDLSRVNREELVFSTEVQEQIDTTVFAPINRRDWCKALGIPFKRGVCLMGAYGVGKTLAVYVAAQMAKEHGITFVLVEDPETLPQAMQFARQYAPAVVAAEDIDRVTRERNDVCNGIMDALDGVEAKDTDVMVLFTSNHGDHIHEAMRRPGRIDTFIKVSAPDPLAVEKLLRLYGRGLIAKDENLRDVGKLLDGQIPAVIREVVERAKLAAVARADSLDDAKEITASDLAIASRRLLMQIGLFDVPKTSEDTRLREAVAVFGEHLVPGVMTSKARGNGHAARV